MKRLSQRAKAKDLALGYGPVVIVAAAVSYLSSRYIFVGSALNLLLWGVIAVAWGASAADKKRALRRGALYGFSQSFIFLWIDKSGGLSIGQFLALCGIITLLSLLAAGCSMLGALLGWRIRKLVIRRKSQE